MAARGFGYRPAPPATAAEMAAPAAGAVRAGDARAAAARAAAAAGAARPGRAVRPGAARRPGDRRLTVSGARTKVTLPVDGCIAAAETRMLGADRVRWTRLRILLGEAEEEALTRLEKDPEFRAATTRWRECARRSGVQAPDPPAVAAGLADTDPAAQPAARIDLGLQGRDRLPGDRVRPVGRDPARAAGPLPHRGPAVDRPAGEAGRGRPGGPRELMSPIAVDFRPVRTVVLTIHVVLAIFLIGPLVARGQPGAPGRCGGGSADTVRLLARTVTIYGWASLLVGSSASGWSGTGSSFSDGWLIVSIVLFVVASVLVLALLVPMLRRATAGTAAVLRRHCRRHGCRAARPVLRPAAAPPRRPRAPPRSPASPASATWPSRSS